LCPFGKFKTFCVLLSKPTPLCGHIDPTYLSPANFNIRLGSGKLGSLNIISVEVSMEAYCMKCKVSKPGKGRFLQHRSNSQPTPGVATTAAFDLLFFATTAL
jgi:hypothetical protein